MKTKKKFGMRRHIGITAAATLIALGATACDDSIYWGGKKNQNTYNNFVDYFGSEDGDFKDVLVDSNAVSKGNCLNDGKGIDELKILFVSDAYSGDGNRFVVMCSEWSDGNKTYYLQNAEKCYIKDNGINCLKLKDKDGKPPLHENGNTAEDLCELGKSVERFVCKKITYYCFGKNDNKKYENCDISETLSEEIPGIFKAAFNYRTCPKDYIFASSYLESSDDYKLSNVCVKSVCGNKPVDLSSDNENCGACGNKCSRKGPGGYTCMNGKCVPADISKVLCEGAFIDPDNDPRYCGVKDDCKGGENCEKNKEGKRLCSNGRCVSTCVGNQILCNGRCVNPLTDNAYCGAKGTCTDDDNNQVNFKGELCSSPTPLCKEGVCSDTCSDGQIVCGGKCIDPLVDSTYCGAIGECNNESPEHIDFRGTQCKDGQVCVKGKCLQNSCSGDLTLCQVGNENKCVDINGADTSNCGKCGLSCDSSKPLHSTVVACELGVCKYTCDEGYVNIGTGTTASSMQCVDLSNDNLNCGQIGRKCPTGNVCYNGDCRASCLERQVLCGTKCVDPSNDNKYCGAKLNGSCSSDNKDDDNYMGSECSGITPLCSGGKCVSTCVGNQIVCGGKCIDPSSDNTYCGAKEGCTEAKQCRGVTPLCSDGDCVSTCIGNQIVCGDRCVDPSSDNSHCGAKGECNNVSTSSSDYRGETCTNGRVCSNGTCALTCETGKIICDNKCVDPDTDNTYCGAKGKCNSDSVSDANYKGQNCADGTKCTDRVCKISCVSGQIACDGECINLVATNVESCTSDKIQCKVGYENCDKEVANGCEVDTSNDNAHCGGCGNACTTAIVQNSASVQCSNGGCKVTSCARGYVLKNGECKVSNTLGCCGTLCTNCYEKYPNMNEGSCNITDSTCTLQSCNVGYVVSSDGKKCDVAKCLDNGACGDSGKCINGECKCGTNLACSGDTPICNNSQCVACTSETHCPSVANATATCKSNKCEYQCVNDFNNTGNGETTQTIKCENCEKIYSVYVENSGGEGPRGKCVQCSNTNLNFCHVHAYHKNASTYGCDAINECIIVECDPGYHVSSDRKSCEPDTIQACGAHDKDCTGEQGLASSDGDSVECVAGECKAKACIQHQFYLDEDAGKCVASDDQNCGGKGLSCEAHNETGTSGSVFHNAYICNVNNGKCELKCQDGKVLINDSCVNCSNNGECGDSKKCFGSGFGGSKKCHCSDDKDGGICSPGGGCESNSCTYPSIDPMANS